MKTVYQKNAFIMFLAYISKVMRKVLLFSNVYGLLLTIRIITY